MRGQDLWQDVYEERGADPAQKNPHGAATVRLFGVWEKVWTTGSPEEAHQDPLCPRAALPVGHHRLPALPAPTPVRLLAGLLVERLRTVNITHFVQNIINEIMLRKGKQRL